MDADLSQHLAEQVAEAAEISQPLNIIGGTSKAFYGRTPSGKTLETSDHRGIVSYEPSELVLTARAGTPIKEIRSLLAENGQMLGFEPALCNDRSTLGGVVAAGLAGPRRPYAGAARDFILGVKIINGNAEILSFGGQVMKNVAGFDHSRLMAGAMGTLGVLLEVSLRVGPVLQTEATLVLEHADSGQAIELFNRLAGQPLPLSASAWLDGISRIRLSGSEAGVTSAARRIGGEVDGQCNAFWHALANHTLDFFTPDTRLLRASLPPAAPVLTGAETQLIDWGGAQRWVCGAADQEFFDRVSVCGGHVDRFRGGDRQGEVFAALDPVSMQLHKNIKQSFDPKGIFNPGRLYKDL